MVWNLKWIEVGVDYWWIVGMCLGGIDGVGLRWIGRVDLRGIGGGDGGWRG